MTGRALSVTDEQINGARDDGSEGGVLRAELARAQAVLVPFSMEEIIPTGSAVAIYGGKYADTEGAGNRVKVTLAHSATLANNLRWDMWFNGEFFGLCYNIDTGTAPIGLMIDGVAYSVPAWPPVHPIYGTPTVMNTARLNGEIIARDLGPGRHLASIMFPGSVTEDRTWWMHGYLADSAAGYREQQHGGIVSQTQIAVGTAWTNLLVGAVGSATAFPASTRVLMLYNTTASPITVSLALNGDTDIFWSKQIAANDTVPVDFGMPIFQKNYLLAKASATGVVATQIGGL